RRARPGFVLVGIVRPTTEEVFPLTFLAALLAGEGKDEADLERFEQTGGRSTRDGLNPHLTPSGPPPSEAVAAQCWKDQGWREGRWGGHPAIIPGIRTARFRSLRARELIRAVAPETSLTGSLLRAACLPQEHSPVMAGRGQRPPVRGEGHGVDP